MTTTDLVKALKTELVSFGALPVFGVRPTKEEWKLERANRIAVSAYYKAMSRGFEPGHALDDWLAAEVEQTQ
ncbi:MAG: DUF2934 domain-containing protein [Methylophilaceae bacterium]